jgi:hydroxyethylthiazole kinase-like sugar kinase family protein
MVVVAGEAKEVGKLNKAHEEVFGVDVVYYKDKVDFVQVVKLKSKVKTVISGTVEFMACNEEQCLPPNEIPFKIALN